jgi:hypothetical protein
LGTGIKKLSFVKILRSPLENVFDQGGLPNS